MRQLKGKAKETRKEKKERKMENLAIQNQLTTVVAPVLGVFVLLIIVYVYLKTRPGLEA